jgi:lipoate-protein ligase B
MTAPATSAVIAAAPPLAVRRLGRQLYEDVLALQEELLARVADGAPETLLLLEHPPVYTLGRGGDAADLRGAPERRGVPWFRVGRGGGATFHGPGQLVAYPIVRLRAAGRDVSGYVCALERALIDTCAAFGVAATAPSGQIGVWVGGRKIGSVGIGVRRGVAYHGIALNVATDLSYFDAITVCRSDGLRLANLGELRTPAPSLDAVGDAFACALAARLGRALVVTGGSPSAAAAEKPWP